MGRTAVVVGSGPNGLAAAITLARAGWQVTVFEAADTAGGGTRTEELTLPGYLHDVCSAFHPLGVASPFFRSTPLSDFGLSWIVPPIQIAHPLDDGSAAAAALSVEETVHALGEDGPAWAADLGGLAGRWDRLSGSLLGPLARPPRHPLPLAWFGARGVWPATTYLQRRFTTEPARALFAGMAAHAILPLDRPFTASFGLLLGGLAHVGGWPIARGGSAAISGAMLGYLDHLGGKLVTGHHVRSRADLPDADAVMLDTTPSAAATIFGDVLPYRTARRYRRYRHGPGTFKIDLATSAPIPWHADACRTAGTVHVGGSWTEIAHAEKQVSRGETPERPFVLVGQQSVLDPTRTPDAGHAVWAYCHVPARSHADMTDRVLDQIERFAPGFQATIRATATTTSAEFEASNPNYVGGDISGGAHDGLQLLLRNGLSPYRTGIPGVYLCSSSTPPGAGVHGMCGQNAAEVALADLDKGN